MTWPIAGLWGSPGQWCGSWMQGRCGRISLHCLSLTPSSCASLLAPLPPACPGPRSSTQAPLLLRVRWSLLGTGLLYRKFAFQEKRLLEGVLTPEAWSWKMSFPQCPLRGVLGHGLLLLRVTPYALLAPQDLGCGLSGSLALGSPRRFHPRLHLVRAYTHFTRDCQNRVRTL